MSEGVVTVLTPLLIIVLTYFSALWIERGTESVRKKIVYGSSIMMIIVVLIFFKYSGWMAGSLISSLVVPLGISYIAFQSIGYLIEVYRENLQAEKHLGFFTTYLLFFPKLVAGPVERAQHFLPQINKPARFNYELFTSGARQFAWGLFKKLVIANRLGAFVNSVYGDLYQNQGLDLLVAAIMFSLQLYADFSGYTDMALGTGKMLGYELAPNFNLPFSAKSMAEFWRRWHISLSTWFNDYFYMPLSIALRNWGKAGIIFSFIITFLVLGLWHGPNWTYVVFGGIHGLAIAVEFLTTKSRKKIRKKIPVGLNSFLGILYVVAFFIFSGIFFRAGSVNDALYFVSHLFSGVSEWFQFSFIVSSLQNHGLGMGDYICILLTVPFMFFVEWKSGIANVVKLPPGTRWVVYYFFILITIVYATPSHSGFIYKQF